MDAKLMAKGPAYCRRLCREEVDRKLRGPHRTSEGLCKFDHENFAPILHFCDGLYNDAFVSGDVLDVKQSRFPQENAKLHRDMTQLARRDKVLALKTIAGSGGAAVLFAAVVRPHGVGSGWSVRLVPLPVDTRESRRFRAFFNIFPKA